MLVNIIFLLRKLVHTLMLTMLVGNSSLSKSDKVQPDKVQPDKRLRSYPYRQGVNARLRGGGGGGDITKC